MQESRRRKKDVKNPFHSKYIENAVASSSDSLNLDIKGILVAMERNENPIHSKYIDLLMLRVRQIL